MKIERLYISMKTKETVLSILLLSNFGGPNEIYG